MINIGIIGYGYWGPNLVRNFAETPGASVAAVADLDTAKLAIVQRRFPAVKTTTDFHDLLNDPASTPSPSRRRSARISSWRWRRFARASTCGSKSR